MRDDRIVQKMEAKRLVLSDPLAKHLPAHLDHLLRRDGYDTDLITLEQVLSHRAGFHEHPAVPSYTTRLRTDPRYRWTREEQLQWLVDSLNPVGAPGGQFRYSDSGYTLLGAIIERNTDQPLGPAVRRLLDFDTHGLRSTWWETMESIPTGVAPRAHQRSRLGAPRWPDMGWGSSERPSEACAASGTAAFGAPRPWYSLPPV